MTTSRWIHSVVQTARLITEDVTPREEFNTAEGLSTASQSLKTLLSTHRAFFSQELLKKFGDAERNITIVVNRLAKTPNVADPTVGRLISDTSDDIGEIVEEIRGIVSTVLLRTIITIHQTLIKIENAALDSADDD